MGDTIESNSPQPEGDKTKPNPAPTVMESLHNTDHVHACSDIDKNGSQSMTENMGEEAPSSELTQKEEPEKEHSSHDATSDPNNDTMTTPPNTPIKGGDKERGATKEDDADEILEGITYEGESKYIIFRNNPLLPQQ